MTVKELIEELKKFDPDKQVIYVSKFDENQIVEKVIDSKSYNEYDYSLWEEVVQIV